MPATWELFSKEVIGEVVSPTEGNARYVATIMVSKWIDQGLTKEEIFKKWNQGNTGDCVRGVNKYNVRYDSCAYVEKAMIAYNQI